MSHQYQNLEAHHPHLFLRAVDLRHELVDPGLDLHLQVPVRVLSLGPHVSTLFVKLARDVVDATLERRHLVLDDKNKFE